MNRKKQERDINSSINSLEINQLKIILMPLRNQNKKAFSEATSDGVPSILLNTKELTDDELENLHQKITNALK